MALAVVIIRVTFGTTLPFACRVLLRPVPAGMAGTIVILRIIPRTAGAGGTVIHAGLAALVALAVIIIRVTCRAALSFACLLRPVLAGMTGPVVIIRRAERATSAGVTVIRAAVITLVALAIVNIRVAFGTALAVARGIDIGSRTARTAVIPAHRGHRCKD